MIENWARANSIVVWPGVRGWRVVLHARGELVLDGHDMTKKEMRAEFGRFVDNIFLHPNCRKIEIFQEGLRFVAVYEEEVA